MMFEPFLNLAQAPEIKIASRSSTINMLFTGSMFRIHNCGHSIMDPSTLMHAINLTVSVLPLPLVSPP